MSLQRPAAIFVTAMLLAFGPRAILAADALGQKIEAAGTTVTFAQTIDWYDDTHFVVGRWDGTLSFFRTPVAKGEGPLVVAAASAPSGHGVEMVVALNDKTIVSSDGTQGLAVWARPSLTTEKFELTQQPKFDPARGAANSGLSLELNGAKYLVTGHESGFVLIWEIAKDGSFTLRKEIDARSPNKPSNPWGIHNIRGLAAWGAATFVTGSEDGDLVGFGIPDGNELFRVRYNDKAERGINNISIVGNILLVANCAVGPADKNIWLFDLTSRSPVLTDSDNLVLDTSRKQVFNFDADLDQTRDGDLAFFSSTEEGLLWTGKIASGRLEVTDVTEVSPQGGSIIDLAPQSDLVATATFAVRLFNSP
ncbi:hypothetical protein CN186_20170 [Sinorhizobium medicae]|uniref:hypothetical protein n=1 Tax=Sinorhizobium medicae TaxID=110321 RepID=UPI000FD9DA08|nr:hypothetical protein [Sinorhizobium medicae]MDW9959475.1 hypothetical protein [Sinorhizobium meliloti]RVI91875.1 hypothetical protein CN186_20170 [Sinorhizobium medicae]